MRLQAEAGESLWFLADAGSRHGTLLNGMKLPPDRELPVRTGDTFTIASWTFRISTAGTTSTDDTASIAYDTLDDSATVLMNVSSLDPRDAGILAQQRLHSLLDCAAAIHAAGDEAAFGDAVLDAAVMGTGFANAALLRPMTEDGHVEVIAHRGRLLDAAGHPLLSRTLIRRAAEGSPARLSGAGAAADALSVVQLQIDEALCLPILLGTAVAGFLYLDNRGAQAGRDRIAADANAFAIGLARLTAMALANLQRLRVEREHAAIEAELNAAAEAQRWVLPPREGQFGPFRYLGQSRPGRYVGGDFFDVIPLDEDRLAVALGDVAGKGIPAAVLMTASQGFLHAILRHDGDPASAVMKLNRFVCGRFLEGKFMTLWLGVFDFRAATIRYVDAGHGYARLRKPDGTCDSLDDNTSIVLGFDADIGYEARTVPMTPGGSVLVVSDGFVEQPSPEPPGSIKTPPHQFGMEGVQACWNAAPADADLLAALYAAVEKHAGTTALADDATAVLVQW